MGGGVRPAQACARTARPVAQPVPLNAAAIAPRAAPDASSAANAADGPAGGGEAADIGGNDPSAPPKPKTTTTHTLAWSRVAQRHLLAAGLAPKAADTLNAKDAPLTVAMWQADKTIRSTEL